LALSLSGDGWTYQSSVVSAVISLPAYISHLGYGTTQYIPEGPGQWIGPVYSLGQLFGGLVCSWFCDRFGRKFTLMMGALMIDLSVSLMMWSPKLGVVILSRILEGSSHFSSKDGGVNGRCVNRILVIGVSGLYC
jgi:MFS family permease